MTSARCAGMLLQDETPVRHHPSVSWALVASAERARLFARNGGAWELVESFEDAPARQRARDVMAEPSGRRMAQQSGTSDTHASVVVARELAARLERAVTDRAFGELYIVAPHDFLESLKSSLSLEVQRRVQQYVDNDFTQWSEAATKVRLDEQLGIRARSFLSFDESA